MRITQPGPSIDPGYRKLSQLEDIEEDLGIDLATLFKALKDGIYIFEYGVIKHKFIRSIMNDGLSMIDGCSVECDGIAYYKAYGKTWALTKEELEGDK